MGKHGGGASGPSGQQWQFLDPHLEQGLRVGGGDLLSSLGSSLREALLYCSWLHGIQVWLFDLLGFP